MASGRERMFYELSKLKLEGIEIILTPFPFIFKGFRAFPQPKKKECHVHTHSISNDLLILKHFLKISSDKLKLILVINI